MSGINTGRVILGGLLAGLVLNVGEFILNMFVIDEERMTEIYSAMNLDPPGSSAIAIFVVLLFVLGITTVWVYAAMRQRLGPGPKSAAIAAIPIWIAGFLIPTVGYAVQGMVPTNLAILAMVWGLAEMIAAAIVGAWLYTEGEAAAGGGPAM